MTQGRSPELTKAIEPYIYEITKDNEGSISAEHGLGVMKVNFCVYSNVMMQAPYLEYSKSADMIAAMRQVKKIFDPKGILNPYKYFP